MNTQYSITKQELADIVSRLGIRSLVIGYYLVIDVWSLVIEDEVLVLKLVVYLLVRFIWN